MKALVTRYTFKNEEKTNVLVLSSDTPVAELMGQPSDSGSINIIDANLSNTASALTENFLVALRHMKYLWMNSPKGDQVKAILGEEECQEVDRFLTLADDVTMKLLF